MTQEEQARDPAEMTVGDAPVGLLRLVRGDALVVKTGSRHMKGHCLCYSISTGHCLDKEDTDAAWCVPVELPSQEPEPAQPSPAVSRELLQDLADIVGVTGIEAHLQAAGIEVEPEARPEMVLLRRASGDEYLGFIDGAEEGPEFVSQQSLVSGERILHAETRIVEGDTVEPLVLKSELEYAKTKFKSAEALLEPYQTKVDGMNRSLLEIQEAQKKGLWGTSHTMVNEAIICNYPPKPE